MCEIRDESESSTGPSAQRNPLLEEVASALRIEAANSGFSNCRITTAEPAPHAEEFIAWLNEGNHADMGWLAENPERRTTPKVVFPEAKAVVLLATNYFQGAGIGRPAAAGRISRYAYGWDYHDILRDRLERLDLLLSSHGGIQRCYTDTGPVLERDLAARAGLGWQGKSTMLLNETLGTWFFISTILTSLPLPADPPVKHRCGTCSRCITACPTGAITEPYKLDARRCIAWLTIENRGPIPPELREAVGDRIFGCDDCLDACPWNRFAEATKETAFHMPPELAAMPLRELLHLDRPAFNRLFKGSPIKRAKYAGFLRNVAVALGNVGGREDLTALEAAANSPEPLVAEHAAWAVQKINARLASGHQEGRQYPVPPHARET